MPSSAHLLSLKALSAALSACRWTDAEIARLLDAKLGGKASKTCARVSTGLLAAFPHGFAPSAKRIEQHLRRDARLLALLRRRAPLPMPLTAPGFAPRPPFDALGLPALATTADLAEHLAISPEQLTRFADLRGLSNARGDSFGAHYRFHLIPKRTAGLRLIEEPKPFLKTLQRRLYHSLLAKVPPHGAAHGFTPGRSCLTAAAKHCGERMVVRFDLRDFFASIPARRIYGIFRSLGYPHAVAQSLTGLTTLATPADILPRLPGAAHATLRQRHLPQGAPTSPALANLAAFALDRRLSGLARSLGGTYTRYADDLTFSGDRCIAAPLNALVPQILSDEGVSANPTKTRALPAHRRQTVTGITVNRHINLDRRSYDRLKATLHHLSNPADPRRSDPAYLAQLSGRIGWAEQLNPHKGARLRNRFNALLSDVAPPTPTR